MSSDQLQAHDLQMSVWIERDTDGACRVDLLTDRPRRAGRAHDLRKFHHAFTSTVAGKLDAFLQAEQTTLFAVVLVGLQALLHRWTRQETVALAAASARTDHVAHRFTAELADRPTARSLLADVRRALHALHQLTTPASSERELAFDVAWLGDRLSVDVEYDASVFDEGTIARLMRNLERLLESMLADPAAPVATLDLLTSQERSQLLVEWNDTRRSYPTGLCVHELIERQVEKTPDAIALSLDERTLGYRDMNRASNRLAHELRARGVGPDSLVVVVAERSFELVIALLAVVKAGGAYVPLLPSYPKQRLRDVVDDARPVVILADGAGRVAFGEESGDTIPMLALEHPLPESLPDSNPSVEGLRDEHLAYVIYTSGSTGKPKGVLVSHRSLVNDIFWQRDVFGFTERDAFLGHTPFSFDASMWEVWTPFTIGARLVLLPQGSEADAEMIVETILSRRITVAQFVPSLLRLVVEVGGFSCRVLVSGGEALETSLAAAARHFASGAFVNIYGPTETTVDATSWTYPPGADVDTIPIGRPIANLTTYVLDAERQLVPVGVPGELYIGGVGVARGYLNRPALTDEKFVPNPFGEGRVYRTGDLARWLADGTLLYLGRVDHQVKIRGYRIELGEIEAALCEQSGVREALVVARELRGEKELVAYVVRAPGRIDVRELRGALKARLPAYMVPSAFVVLDAFPLTSNGKVNRAALPESTAEVDADRTYLAPRNSIEQQLAKIWSEMLGLPRVGIDENFFELGGHSMRATQLVSRIRQTFQVELTLRNVFETPTIAGIGEAVAHAIGSTGDQIPVVARTRELGLSFPEQRLFFHDRMEPGSPLYNIASAMRLVGPLELARLKQSLEAVVRRHETLRTTYRAHDANPVRAIARELAFDLPLVDLSALEQGGREAELLRLVDAETHTPFELAAGPLFRAKVFRLDPSTHVVLLCVHHIISDGWSIAVLWEELAAVYSALATSREPALPQLPIQYADYAVWQESRLASDDLGPQLAYWKKTLEGAPNLLNLTADRPRPAVQRYRGATMRFELSSELTSALNALSRAESVTLFMTLLAAFQTLLHRYTRQDDIVVGTPIAGRNRSETEPLLGFFVNSVAMRTNLAGTPTFRELLARVRDVALGAYAHQDVPFEKVVEEVNPTRSLSYAPLFQVMFVLQNAWTPISFEGISCDVVHVANPGAKFDLTLELEELGSSLCGGVEYNTDLFDASTIARMIEHFQTLLVAVANDADRALHSLPLMTERERRQVLVDWNETTQPFDADTCIDEMVARIARSSPDAVALEYRDQRVTYRELDEQSNQLAHVLKAHGVGRGDVVPVLVERSPIMVIAWLAAFKADAAYFPIAPDLGSERIAYMVRDSKAPVIVTNERLAASIQLQGTLVLVDRDAELIRSQPTSLPPGSRTPEDPAYVIYTSGSTGMPKGSLVPHRSLSNLIAWHQRNFLSGPGLRCGQVVGISFDVSVYDTWPVLVVGGVLVMLPDERLRPDPKALRDWLLDAQIAIAFVPTPIAEPMLLLDWPPSSPFRQMLTGGDALNRPPPPGLPFNLINDYGPSECTVVSIATEVAPADPASVMKPPPIGRPVDNTAIYIVGPHGEPVPTGVPGEIWIGGVAVGCGYLHRAELTAEKFITNPFGDGRVYRTGDLARWLSNGEIEFLGRIDNQVKIRGYRIELGEIEAQLLKAPGIQEVVVIVREDVPGDKRLVAYVVGKDHRPEPAKMRAHLTDKLPDYMIPSAFIALDALPLTDNGKVNTKLLPAPDASGSAGQAYVAPRTIVEEVLAGIWAELLRLERVGIHDNFFQLGGHSLLAMQVMARVRDALRVELPLRTLFESATIAVFAERIEAELQRVQGSAAVGADSDIATIIESVTRLGERELAAELAEWQQVRLEVTPVPEAAGLAADRRMLAERITAQHRIDARRTAMLCARDNPKSPTSFAQQLQWDWHQRGNFPELGIHAVAFGVRGAIDVDAMASAVSALVTRQSALRLRFGREGGRLVQTEHATGPALSFVDVSNAAPDQRESLARARFAELSKPHDLAQETFRAELVRLDARDHVLVLSPHHIAIDGFSWSLLESDLTALYRAALGVREAPPALPFSFGDFAFWQRTLETRPVGQRQLAYWQRAVAGYEPLELPADRRAVARGTVAMATDTYAAGGEPFAIEGARWEDVKALCSKLGCTPYAVVSSAMFLLLARWAGRYDVCALSGNFHRERPGNATVIGNFVTPYPFRVRFQENATLESVVLHCHETALANREQGDVAPATALSAWSEWSRYNVNYQLDIGDSEELAFNDVAAQRLGWSAHAPRTPHDLALFVWQSAAGVRGTLSYNAERFSPELARRANALLGALVDAISKEPERRVDSLPRVP